VKSDLPNDYLLEAEHRFYSCAHLIVSAATEYVCKKLAACDYKEIPGLQGKERETLRNFQFYEAEVVKLEQSVRRLFLESGWGLPRLHKKAVRQASQRALHRGIQKYTKKRRSVTTPASYFAAKYAPLMAYLDLPYHDILFIDASLSRHMPSNPVRLGKVAATPRSKSAKPVAAPAG
jgi:hypothetical protein